MGACRSQHSCTTRRRSGTRRSPGRSRRPSGSRWPTSGFRSTLPRAYARSKHHGGGSSRPATIDAARADLARFAQGLHPRSLTDGGLRSALVELAGQAACPVVLDATARRFPGAQEAAAYFVCSEGLANVAKYADASRAWIDVEAAGSRLIVRVADDGRGGADPTRGSGLRGLADRIEALGGALSVESPPSAGTRLVASLPISGDPAP